MGTFFLVGSTTFFLLFDDDQENYGKPDSANVAKVKVLYHEINLQGYCKSISKNKNIPTVKANANSVEATMLSNSKFFEINDAMAMVFETNSTTIQSGWWLDSGATVHVCKDKNMFKQFEDVVDSNVQKVLMANKTFAKVDGKGTVEIDFGSGKKITLFNVLYIPEIRKNLISIDLLCKMGLKVLFEFDKVLLLNNDWSVVGNGHANDGMYQLSINNNITSNIASSA